ncbi:hypothetical protein LPJ73_008187, partial [Coemansia sp. RSA 2703]
MVLTRRVSPIESALPHDSLDPQTVDIDAGIVPESTQLLEPDSIDYNAKRHTDNRLLIWSELPYWMKDN